MQRRNPAPRLGSPVYHPTRQWLQNPGAECFVDNHSQLKQAVGVEK